MKLIKEKEGAEKIMSVYWFVILFLVAGAIVYMVAVFYGDPYDVREIETNILMNNIAYCLTKEDGKLREIDEDFRSNFLELCNLNLKTKDDEIQYYIEIEFQDFDTKEVFEYKNIEKGNINLKNNPNTGSIFSNSKSFYVLGNEGEEIIVKIFIVISKTKENVG